MINLVQYINEKLVIFPSQVDEKLVIFPSQVDEKLVINKNFKVTEHFKRGNDFTQEYGYTVSKQLEEKYAKLHDNKNTIYHMHSFCYKWDREELEGVINDINAKIYNKTNNIEDKNFIYLFSFDIFGLKNITFMTYVFEDNFSIILLKNAKVSQIKEVQPIFKKLGYDMYNTKNIYPFYYNSKYLFISTETFTNIDDINELFDVVYDVSQGLNPHDMSKQVIGQGEVLPGWTIDDIKKRYDSIFDDIKVMRSGNVKLGHLKEKGIDSSYERSTFRIDTNIKYRNGIMIGKRLDGSSSSGNNFVLEPTVDKAFDELDKKLRKKGYTI